MKLKRYQKNIIRALALVVALICAGVVLLWFFPVSSSFINDTIRNEFISYYEMQIQFKKSVVYLSRGKCVFTEPRIIDPLSEHSLTMARVEVYLSPLKLFRKRPGWLKSFNLICREPFSLTLHKDNVAVDDSLRVISKLIDAAQRRRSQSGELPEIYISNLGCTAFRKTGEGKTILASLTNARASLTQDQRTLRCILKGDVRTETEGVLRSVITYDPEKNNVSWTGNLNKVMLLIPLGQENVRIDLADVATTGSLFYHSDRIAFSHTTFIKEMGCGFSGQDIEISDRDVVVSTECDYHFPTHTLKVNTLSVKSPKVCLNAVGRLFARDVFEYNAALNFTHISQELSAFLTRNLREQSSFALSHGDQDVTLFLKLQGNRHDYPSFESYLTLHNLKMFSKKHGMDIRIDTAGIRATTNTLHIDKCDAVVNGVPVRISADVTYSPSLYSPNTITVLCNHTLDTGGTPFPLFPALEIPVGTEIKGNLKGKTRLTVSKQDALSGVTVSGRSDVTLDRLSVVLNGTTHVKTPHCVATITGKIVSGETAPMYTFSTDARLSSTTAQMVFEEQPFKRFINMQGDFASSITLSSVPGRSTPILSGVGSFRNLALYNNLKTTLPEVYNAQGDFEMNERNSTVHLEHAVLTSGSRGGKPHTDSRLQITSPSLTMIPGRLDCSGVLSIFNNKGSLLLHTKGDLSEIDQIAGEWLMGVDLSGHGSLSLNTTMDSSYLPEKNLSLQPFMGAALFQYLHTLQPDRLKDVLDYSLDCTAYDAALIIKAFPQPVTHIRGNVHFNKKSIKGEFPSVQWGSSGQLYTHLEATLDGEYPIVRLQVTGPYIDIQEWTSGWARSTDPAVRARKTMASISRSTSPTVEVFGHITTEGADYKRMNLDRTDVAFTYRNYRDRPNSIFFDRIAIEAYGGACNASFQLLLPTDGAMYQIEGKVHKVALRDLLATLGAEQKIEGELDGAIVLSGHGKSIETLSGQGNLQLNKSRFIGNVIFKTLGNVLNLPGFKEISFTTVKGEFVIKNEATFWKQLVFENPFLNLVSEGKIYFDKRMDMDVTISIIRSVASFFFPLKLLNELLEKIGGHVFKVKITGTLDDPMIRPVLFSSDKIL